MQLVGEITDSVVPITFQNSARNHKEESSRDMFSIKISIPSLLAQVPSLAHPTAVLPPEEALRVIRPVLSQHAVLPAVEGFGQWILDRRSQVSVEQIAYLWVNYESVFLKELPSRFMQWSEDPSATCSPYAQGVQFARMLRLRRWEPFAIRKSGTYAGRLQIKLLKALGNGLTFFIFFLAATSVWNELTALREHITIGATLRGCVLKSA